MGEWKEIKLGEIADLIMGQSPDGKYYNSEGNGMPFLQGCSEFGKHHPETTIFSTDIKKLAPENSILFSVRAPVGKTNLANKKYCIGRGIAAIKGKDVDNSFLNHAIFFRSINGGFISQGSTFDSINHSELSKLEILLPLEKIEQTTIATILTTIDQAIEKTEQLIAKYERVKTGLMQDLLTCGIDEQGNIRSEETHEFKDSVLGRIPKEWEVENLGGLANFISGKAWSTKLLSEHGMKIIRISNLHKPDFPYWRFDGKYTEDMIVNTGDVLFSWAGVASSIDCVQYLGEPALLNQHIYNLKFSDDKLKMFTHRYINWFLPSLRKEIEGGAGQLHLTKDKIQSIKVPMPKHEELLKINEKLQSMDSLIDGEWNSLLKLKSQKTGLMQDLLTGKVHVDALL